MRQGNRLPFYVSWHLIWAFIITFMVAFLSLHGFSMYYTGRGFWESEAIWRTITVAIPKWDFLVFPALIPIWTFSVIVHGFIRGLQIRGLGMIVYSILTVLVVVLFVFIFQVASLFILVPLFTEALMINKIDSILDKLE